MKSGDYTKFIWWMKDNGYLDDSDVEEDGKEIFEDMEKVSFVAPKFYNLLMNIFDQYE